jgi:MYXO-CTERM domain-containing protein
MRSLLASLVLISAVSNAYELKRDSTGAVASWKKQIHFIVDEKLAAKLNTPKATDAVQAALATVRTSAPGLAMDAVQGNTHAVGYDFEHPSASTSDVVVPEEWIWDEDAVAITVVTLSRTTHEILEADIAFNAHHTSFAVVDGAKEMGRYDVQNAMTHELGHAVGLGHNTTHPESVMFPHSTPGETSKRALAPDDVAGLHFLYAAVAGVSQVDPSEVATRGCSATGSAAPFALLAVGMLLSRRRRMAIALTVVLGSLSIVAPVFAFKAAPETWTVDSVQTLAPTAGAQILQSEVTYVRGGKTVTVRMPGGRWGDVEQVVEGLSVPSEGDEVVLADLGN